MIDFSSPDLTRLLVAGSVSASLSAALLALLADRYRHYARWLVFVPLGLGGICGILAGVGLLFGLPGFTIILPLGLPWLQWHLNFDLLSGFFLAIIGVVTIAVSIFGPGYVRDYERGHYSQTVLGLATGLFIAGMQLVVLADDTFAFMIAWELMSVSSYLLVAYEHHESANRRAAFIYLLMAQIGAVLILLAFGVLSGFGGDLSFSHLRAHELTPAWSAIAFALALTGFGMKAGIVPLHIWLPEAHPVAPSHISALMSGVMLKVAVYGFIRYTFDLLGAPHWGWGVAVLIVGSITALYGVLYALMQHDLKRLLAYHSVENIGIIYIGLGLSMIFFGSGFPKLGLIGLVGALYHTLNHALFKSLLFLGAGAILQRSHEHNLEHMGGLIRHMPWTALFFLIGCLSISALPPFNGFVSEWLIFQTALQAPALQGGVLRAIIPLTAAMLALSGALAATCFVKVFSVAFLGQGRVKRVRHVREARPSMVFAQGLLAGLCVLFGVLPTFTVEAIGRVTAELTGETLASATRHGWLWLTPVAPEVASYSAPLISLGVLLALAAWALVYLSARRRRGMSPVPRRDPWDCGFGSLTSRMQYTPTAFTMPIRQIFQPIFRLHEESIRDMDPRLPTRPAQLQHSINVEDITWNACYRPVEHAIHRLSRLVGRIQTGHLRHYLAYSFITLLVLLWLIA
jgi:formate hydrogenlyase subunit 3/multisubunit Na+/H+ antiporter MnhD subunit